MKLEYSVKSEDSYKIIKDILLSYFKVSHRLLITLKRENCIFLNDFPTPIYHTLNVGDKISISFDYDEDNSNIVSTQIPLDIIYEDDCFLIINKSAGVPVHPSILHYEDSLSNGIRFYFDSIGLKKKIRPVNRIDKDTSGLVVFAKNEYVQEALAGQMLTGSFKKEYIAIAEGYFKNKKGTIHAPIARKENSIMERCICHNGSPSITHYEVIKEGNQQNIPFSIVKCVLETGRTHQIRVHMAYTHHPLLGDDLYGGNTNLITRQALHSYQISFIHPITKQPLILKAPLPKSLKQFLNFCI